MWTTKTKSCAVCFIAAFSFLFWPAVGGCSPNQMYQISETELEMLQNHLIALERNNSELLRLLDESNLDLSRASSSLSASKSEIETLKAQLQALQAETKSLSESLRIANAELQNAKASFKASERERDRIEGRLRTQRNIWEALFAVAVGVAVAR